MLIETVIIFCVSEGGVNDHDIRLWGGFITLAAVLCGDQMLVFPG